jgi:hypothetical protein
MILDLIPIVADAARNVGSEHEKDEMMTSQALSHTEDLNAWLYGLKVGSINKTRYKFSQTTWKSWLSARKVLGNALKGCQEPQFHSTTAQL